MSAPTPKRIALLVTALMVVSAVALILSASDYEGQDGAETTEDPVTEVWTDAKAVIFDSSNSSATKTYYTSIQGAIDTVIEAVETDAETTWKWTIYVKAQTIDTTVNVPYQSSTSSHPANSPGLVEITLKGISSDAEPEEGLSVDFLLEYGPWWLLNNITPEGIQSDFVRAVLYSEQKMEIFSVMQDNGWYWVNMYVGHSDNLSYV